MKRDRAEAAVLGTMRAAKIARWVEWLSIAWLVALTVYFIAISWRKWCHPIVDSGRELYTPWRLSEGAVLYREVDDVYGPFSQYFNAGLFKLFGPGLMVLVTANLVVFAGILALAYLLFRRAWGPVGAIGACAVFVSVFAFCPLLNLNIFNYAFPYAHEATHGMLVVLALVSVVGRWLENPTRGRCVAAGCLTGLTLVIKPEFMLAAAGVIVTAIILQSRDSHRRPWDSGLIFVAAAVFPTAAFAGYFACFFPPLEAVSAACRAWWSLLIMPDIAAMHYQRAFMGLDQPGANFFQHVHRTAIVMTTLGLLGGLLAGLLRWLPRGQWVGVTVLMALAFVIGMRVDWGLMGRCLLGCGLIYLAFAYWRRLRKSGRPEPSCDASCSWRILLTMLAVALMARMVLNGRIDQFGFFQAALAAMVVMAVVCAEAAEWMPPSRLRRSAVAGVAFALFAPGVIWAGTRAKQYYSWQTLPLAEGRDQFYHFAPEEEASGALLNEVVAVLRTMPKDTTLLALPEGSMVNYLARLRSPLPQFQYYSFTTEGGREAKVVERLAARPPDIVVVISRFGLGDFKIARYGERVGAGRQIIEWVKENYDLTHHFGGDPLASDQRGAVIMARKK